MAPPVVAIIAGSLAVAGTTYAFKKFVYDPHLSQWVEDVLRNIQARNGWYAQSEDPDPTLTDPFRDEPDDTRASSTARAREDFFGASGDYELRRRGRQEPSLPQEEQWILAEQSRRENEARRGDIVFSAGRGTEEEEDPFSDQRAVGVRTRSSNLTGGQNDVSFSSIGRRWSKSRSRAPGSEDTLPDQSTSSPWDTLGQSQSISDTHHIIPKLPSVSPDPSIPPRASFGHLVDNFDVEGPSSSANAWSASLSDFTNSPNRTHEQSLHPISPPTSSISSSHAHPTSPPLSPFSATTSADAGSNMDYGVFSLSSLPDNREDATGNTALFPDGGAGMSGTPGSMGLMQGGVGSRRTSRGSRSSDSGWTDAEVRSDT